MVDGVVVVSALSPVEVPRGTDERLAPRTVTVTGAEVDGAKAESPL